MERSPQVIHHLRSANTIRRAVAGDAERIAEIWAKGFSSGFASELPPHVDYRSYFDAAVGRRAEPFCYWVVEDASGTIIAWIGLSPCRSNPISRSMMAEMSCYVDPGHVSGGVMTDAIDRVLAEIDTTFSLHYVVGFIAATNSASLRLCERAGFETIGELPLSPHAPESVPRCFLVRPCGVRVAAVERDASAA